MGCVYVAWENDVMEAIRVGYVSASVVVTTADEDAFVFQSFGMGFVWVYEVGERSVGLYDHGGVELDIKFCAQVLDAF